MLDDILIDPDQGIAHANQAHYGTTSYRVGGEEFQMQTTARGIELSRPGINKQQEPHLQGAAVVGGGAIRTPPAHVVAELRAQRQDLIRTTRSHPAYPVGQRTRRRNGGNATISPVAGPALGHPGLSWRPHSTPQFLAVQKAQPALSNVDPTPHTLPAAQPSRPAARRMVQV
jgi:hypothetical protein